jgi:hypothetical protein
MTDEKNSLDKDQLIEETKSSFLVEGRSSST